MIGQVDEPFQMILLYTSCLGEDGGTVALDSLELIDCGSGELSPYLKVVTISIQTKHCTFSFNLFFVILFFTLKSVHVPDD